MESFEAESGMLLWFFRRENTIAKVSVGSIHNLALEEIPAVLLVIISSGLGEERELGLEVSFPDYNFALL